MMSPTIKTALRAAALVAGAALSLAATGKTTRPLAAPAVTNWGAQVSVTANGSHRLGNPDAPVKLVEYVSYTCPHCAHFHKEADPALRMTLVPKGRVSVTVTNLLRNPIDLTVAMLVNCGDPKRFFTRHRAFFATQDTWLAKAGNAIAASARSLAASACARSAAVVSTASEVPIASTSRRTPAWATATAGTDPARHSSSAGTRARCPSGCGRWQAISASMPLSPAGASPAPRRMPAWQTRPRSRNCGPSRRKWRS